jgi:L-lactate dehydrogenase complex protein LldG
MSSAREDILGAIRRSLKRGPVDEESRSALDWRLASHPRGLGLKRTDLSQAELVKLFIGYATATQATLVELRRADDVPAAVADYLAQHNLPAAIAASPALKNLPWRSRPALSVRFGRGQDADLVSVTPAHAGIAETGTLMLASSADRPITLNFLPDTHMVVLDRRSIVANYEDGWDRWRAEHPEGPPRTVNFITGPSRTADIEQKILYGAHGPRRLHILLVGADD